MKMKAMLRCTMNVSYTMSMKVDQECRRTAEEEEGEHAERKTGKDRSSGHMEE